MFDSGEWFQVLAAIAASLGQGTVGHIVPLSSFALPQLMEGGATGDADDFTISEEQGSWFASLFAIGSLTGSITGGFACDKFGRRISMLIDCVGLILGLLLMALSNSFSILLIGRFLSGHFAGSNLVSVPIFISETSHPRLRGMTSTLLMVMYTSGFTISMFLGAIFPWRRAVLVTVATPALSALLLLFSKESPTWLLKRGRGKEAMDSLRFYRSDEQIASLEHGRILENLREIEKEREGSSENGLKNKLRRMQDPAFYKPFLLLNLMLSIGLDWAGFPALAFYMHTLLQDMDVPIDKYWAAAFLGLYRAVMVVGLSFLLVKVPKRSMYLLSASLVLAAVLIQASYATFGSLIPVEYLSVSGYIPLFAIVLQYTGFGLGYGPIVFALQGELLPSDLRSLGGGLLGVIDNVFLFSAIKTVPVLINMIGLGGIFYLYSGVVFTNLLFCSFFLPDTKGLSLEDIEDYYRVAKEKKKPVI